MPVQRSLVRPDAGDRCKWCSGLSKRGYLYRFRSQQHGDHGGVCVVAPATTRTMECTAGNPAPLVAEGPEMMPRLITIIFAVLAPTLALAQPLPVPKPPGPGGSCQAGRKS